MNSEMISINNQDTSKVTQSYSRVEMYSVEMYTVQSGNQQNLEDNQKSTDLPEKIFLSTENDQNKNGDDPSLPKKENVDDKHEKIFNEIDYIKVNQIEEKLYEYPEPVESCDQESHTNDEDNLNEEDKVEDQYLEDYKYKMPTNEPHLLPLYEVNRSSIKNWPKKYAEDSSEKALVVRITLTLREDEERRQKDFIICPTNGNLTYSQKNTACEQEIAIGSALPLLCSKKGKYLIPNDIVLSGTNDNQSDQGLLRHILFKKTLSLFTNKKCTFQNFSKRDIKIICTNSNTKIVPGVFYYGVPAQVEYNIGEKVEVVASYGTYYISIIKRGK